MRGLCICLLAIPLAAHHSTAPYDLTRPALVTGVVTRFEWRNPHALIYLDATNEKGTVEHWTVEIDSPNLLRRQGWAKGTLQQGDRVTCHGARAKDGSPLLRGTMVECPDGRELRS
jgi:hypothetical protein